jgi:hypothetical protein
MPYEPITRDTNLQPSPRVMRKRDKSHNLAGEVITRARRRKRDRETSGENSHPPADPPNLLHQPGLLGPTHMTNGTRQVLRADVLSEILQVQRPVGVPGWQERKQATSPRGSWPGWC